MLNIVRKIKLNLCSMLTPFFAFLKKIANASSKNLYKRKYDRERAARVEAESILESKSSELYLSRNQIQKYVLELEEKDSQLVRALSIKEGELKKFHAELISAQARSDLVLSATKTGIWEFDFKTGKIYCSDTLMTIIKQSESELKKRLRQGTLPNEEFRDELQKTYNNRAALGLSTGVDSVVQVTDGANEVRWMLFRTMTFFNKDGSVCSVVGAIIDVHDRVNGMKTIEYLANNDALTGVPNRSSFNERLEKSLEAYCNYKKHFAVGIIDIDNFKDINDRYGHAAGDDVLKAISGRINSRLHESDFLARLGGDEFVVILEGVEDHKSAQEKAEKLIQESYSVNVNLRKIKCNISFGLALSGKNNLNPSEIMREADFAMYHAKNNKKHANVSCSSVCIYNTDIHNKYLEKQTKKIELSEALNRNEFMLYYQPKYSISEERVMGLEALIRWKRPNGRVAAPNEFISELEEFGLMPAVSTWVIDEACRQASEWLKAGLQIRIDVNLSPVDFEEKDVPSLISKAMQKHGITSSSIGVEILENLGIDKGTTNTFDQLTKLSSMGIEVSIDDFGTGYASLDYLLCLPFDNLKIDRSFIQNLESNNAARVIVDTVIDLSKRLNKKVVAEGVENLAQFEYLASRNCDFIQGYLCARPLSKEDIEPILKNNELSITRAWPVSDTGV